MQNYLLKLGWSHGDDEIILFENAIKWFNLKNIGKSPSRLDFDKLKNINAHYIKNSDNTFLLEQVLNIYKKDNFDILEKSISSIGTE